MNLYEIKSEIAAAIESMFDTVDEETGEIDAGTVERLETLQAAKAEKLDAIGAYIKNLDSDIEGIDAEIKKLTARKKTKENKRNRLKEYVKPFIEEMENKKFESARVVFSLRSSESVNITDESAISAEYMKTKTETTPDLTAIKKAIKAGAVVSGAELITKNNLQIK